MATTLQDIILLAHQQYGIRFQVSQDQLIRFANTVQYIAFNKDLNLFEEWGQVFKLGHDVYLETGAYSAPIDSDIGNNVSGSVSGVIGALKNFRTQNGGSKWIIEPPNGGAAFSVTDGETLTIVGGSSATGVTVTDQDYAVSLGPYRMPSESAGNPPFRKFIGVTSVTDKQLFNVPQNNSFDGFDDYGLFTNNTPGRKQNIPFRLDYLANNPEIELVLSSPPEIDQTDEKFGTGGTTLNTSKLRWIYYRNPPEITAITDDDKLVIPEEYRYEVLYKGISKLADTATYGDAESVREIIEPLCSRFWEDIRVQFQQFGRNSDYVSHGDNFDIYGLGSSSGGSFFSRTGYGNKSRWY